MATVRQMDDQQREKIVRAWISAWLWRDQNPGWHERDDAHPDDWVLDELDDLCHTDPDTTFEVILEILKADSTPSIMEVLAAGPLEDLLARHGPLVIDRIEKQAREEPLFRDLLGGVWQNSTDPVVWHCVVAIRGKPW
jgi:hypothetical protein